MKNNAAIIRSDRLKANDQMKHMSRYIQQQDLKRLEETQQPVQTRAPKLLKLHSVIGCTSGQRAILTVQQVVRADAGRST